MRVLVLSNLYPPDVLGGYEIAAAQVVDGLIARGHDLCVLAGRPRQPVDDPPHVRRRFDLLDEWSPAAMGHHQVTTWLKFARSRIINAYNVHVLTDTIEEFAPDVVYINNLVGLGGLGLLGALKHLEIPWVWQLGDSIPIELCANENGLIPGLAKAFSREVSGTYIAVSQRIHDIHRKLGVSLNRRVELLPNWLTGQRPAPRRRFYRPGEPLKILAAGRVDEQKGMGLVLEAAAQLKGHGIKGFSVDLYGRVTTPTLPGYLLRLGIEDLVALKGPRPHRELLALYDEYDLLLFPTRRAEPFGLVPLEAASRGCVPVISDDCGVAEWLVHAVHCLKTARRPETFANVIRRVIAGEIALEPLARRAAEAAWRDFHLDVVLPKIEDLLREATIEPRGHFDAATNAEAYRLARMAEHMTDLLVQDSLNA